MIWKKPPNAKTPNVVVENPPNGTMAKVNSSDSALANVETNGSEKCPPKTYIENR